MKDPAAVTVVLAGWYGAINLGDELLLSMFIEWVREARRHADRHKRASGTDLGHVRGACRGLH